MFTLWTLIGLFIGYVATHIGIGIWKNGLEKDTTIPDYEKKMIWATRLFKFWAMVYLAFVIVYLYVA
jgi:hypothetical protein